jgi:hypothetical protein
VFRATTSWGCGDDWPAVDFKNDVGSAGGRRLPFERYFQVAAFDAEATTAMGSALEAACKSKGFTDTSDPLVELLAHKIMQLYRLGENDPEKLSDRALKELGGPFG